MPSPFIPLSGTISIEACGTEAWYAVWQGFSFQEVLELLPGLPAGDLHYLSQIGHAHNRAGSASARLVCQYLMGYLSLEYPGLGRDLHGKPLIRLEGWEISLSHAVTGGLAAVMLAKGKPCGIDLESVRPKALSLAPRYLSAEEIERWKPDRPQEACLLWCLKEAAYKRFSHKGLSLRDHLRVYGTETEGQYKIDSLLHGQAVLAQARLLKTAWLAWTV